MTVNTFAYPMVWTTKALVAVSFSLIQAIRYTRGGKGAKIG